MLLVGGYFIDTVVNFFIIKTSQNLIALVLSLRRLIVFAPFFIIIFKT
jgi:hypothetical protein